MRKYCKKSPQKIGILTFHFAYNCGAMLQAYALQKALGEKCSCEIINYAPEYHTKVYIPKIKSYIRINNKRNPLKAIREILVGIYSYFKEKNHLRKCNFERFCKRIPQSRKITTVEELQKALPNYDKVIVGSDQIWRRYSEGYRLEYFLDFPNCNSKKYSYAASAGSCFPQEDILLIKNYLQDFQRISVREKVLEDQLRANGVSCRTDVDPTLLLEKENYLNIEKKVKIKGKYIFVYLCKDERALEVLKQLSNSLNATVIFGPSVIFHGKIDFEYRLMEELGPQEFLYCIHNACFVVTSSFHCTVFSILHEKPFVVFNKVGTFDRIKNLLEQTKLETHIFRSIEEIDMRSNYQSARSAILACAKTSYDYLDQIVND